MTSANHPTVTTTTDRTRPATRRKKKKNTAAANQQSKHTSSLHSTSAQPTLTTSDNWKSQTQQQIYSTKLLRALRHVSISSSSSSGRGGAVREAADRALAVTARGRSRWSRAILTNRLKLDYFRRVNKKKRKVQSGRSAAGMTGTSRSRKTARVSVYRLKAKNLPAVQRKARVLGRLVPGCKKESLPVILEEAKDYIPALEMQIRAMTQLINRLTGSAQPN